MAKQVEAELVLSARDRTARAFDAVERRLKKAERQADAFNRKQARLAKIERGLRPVQQAAAIERAVARSESMLVTGASRAALAVGGVLAAGRVKDAVLDYAALERQMTRIGLAAGATDAETKAATRNLSQMADDAALPFDQAVQGLDALVATGKSLPEAMEFLQSILRTSQASGAATDEMSASSAALATSFKISAGEMQQAFDMLVTGGQLGQFELKDMAASLPSLTASAAKLGFVGLDGTKKLVAMLQTVRQVSGTSAEAATAVGDAVEKTLSPTVATAFKKRGVNIGKVLEEAAQKGENQFEAVIKVLRRLTNGMSDTQRNMFISSIYTDKEARRAVTAMITLADEYQGYVDAVGNSAGATERNLQRVLADTQASVDRLTNSWGNLWKAVGRGVDSAGGSTAMSGAAGAINYALDNQQEAFGRMEAVERELSKLSWWERVKFLSGAGPQELDALARQGGWKPTAESQQSLIVASEEKRNKLAAEIVDREAGLAPFMPGATEDLHRQLAEAEARRQWAMRDLGRPEVLPAYARGGDNWGNVLDRRTVMPLPEANPLRAVPFPQADPRRSGAVMMVPGDTMGGGTLDDEIERLRGAMQSGGDNLQRAGVDVAADIRAAAQDLRDAASALAAGGQKAAAAISTAAPAASPVGRGAYRIGPNANLGQSMPNAGTPGQ